MVITDLGDKRYFFQFFYEVDIRRVLDGIPWSFNRYLLLFHRLDLKEDPKTIPLNHSLFWIQVHNLPFGVVLERLAKNLGDFIGKFIHYDVALITIGERRYVRIDVRAALKRKKVLLDDGPEGHAFFQYGRLTLFCFICGKLGHGEGFCPIHNTIGVQKVTFGWNLSLRAPTREELRASSKWLKEDGLIGAQWGALSNRMDVDKGKRIVEYDEEEDITDGLNIRIQENENTRVKVSEGKKRQRTRIAL